jgi:hypothetical protein
MPTIALHSTECTLSARRFGACRPTWAYSEGRESLTWCLATPSGPTVKAVENGSPRLGLQACSEALAVGAPRMCGGKPDAATQGLPDRHQHWQG